MNGIASLPTDQALRLANERLSGYRTESAMTRLASSAKPKALRFAGVRAALASFRSAFTTIDTEPGPALPTLKDYPYRA